MLYTISKNNHVQELQNPSAQVLFHAYAETLSIIAVSESVNGSLLSVDMSDDNAYFALVNRQKSIVKRSKTLYGLLSNVRDDDDYSLNVITGNERHDVRIRLLGYEGTDTFIRLCHLGAFDYAPVYDDMTPYVTYDGSYDLD